MRERVPDMKSLLSVDDTKAQIAAHMTDQLKTYLHNVDAGYRLSLKRTIGCHLRQNVPCDFSHDFLVARPAFQRSGTDGTTASPP